MFKEFHHQKNRQLLLIGIDHEADRVHVGDWGVGCPAEAVELMLHAAVLHARGTGVFDAAHEMMKKKRAPRGSKRRLK